MGKFDGINPIPGGIDIGDEIWTPDGYGKVQELRYVEGQDAYYVKFKGKVNWNRLYLREEVEPP